MGKYYITGSFNEWGMAEMELDDQPGSFVYRVELTEYGTPFHIVIDADPYQVLYPQIHSSISGESALEGPAFKSLDEDNRFWMIQGIPGDVYEVTLNLSTEDRRQMVTWKPAS